MRNGRAEPLIVDEYWGRNQDRIPRLGELELEAFGEKPKTRNRIRIRGFMMRIGERLRRANAASRRAKQLVASSEREVQGVLSKTRQSVKAEREAAEAWATETARQVGLWFEGRFGMSLPDREVDELVKRARRAVVTR